MWEPAFEVLCVSVCHSKQLLLESADSYTARCAWCVLQDKKQGGEENVQLGRKLVKSSGYYNRTEQHFYIVLSGNVIIFKWWLRSLAFSF